MKLTKNRQKVLDLIQISDIPVNVKFLKTKVDFDLSTIYRALDFLEKNKLVFSFDFENEKYYFKEENANFFICDTCKHIETVPDFSDSEIEKEKNTLEKKDFLFYRIYPFLRGNVATAIK